MSPRPIPAWPTVKIEPVTRHDGVWLEAVTLSDCDEFGGMLHVLRARYTPAIEADVRGALLDKLRARIEAA